MDYKIMEKPAFDLVGRGKKFTTADGTNLVKIPQFWQEFSASEEYQKLVKLGGGKPGPATEAEILSAILPNENNTWDPIIYTICIEKTSNTGNFDVYHVPAATWVIFESTGPMPKAIQDVTVKIFQEWFPSTGYEHDAKPELEVYLPGDPNSPDYRCQVWMPIMKKKRK
jgi:AraC family transcriptional regulator